MAVIPSLPSAAVIDGLRGVLDFYQWCGLNIVRKWPRQQTIESTPGEAAASNALSYASHLASTLPAHVIESWHYLADQSNLTWKDWLIRAYLSGTLTPPGMPPL